MVGYLAWAEPGRGQRSVRLEERIVLRMRFLQAGIVKGPHQAVTRRRVLAAGKKLRKRGVAQVVRTVTELALRHRYVLLDLPYGGEELCRQLRREYGVSLLLGPDREQLEGADALVLFDPRADLRRRDGVTLPLYDEAAPMGGVSLPPALEERLPEGAGRGQMLAALVEAGVLRLGQAGVSA